MIFLYEFLLSAQIPQFFGGSVATTRDGASIKAKWGNLQGFHHEKNCDLK